jgi:AraC-like DNA-binding protein
MRSIGEIASETGFSDVTYFISTFKKGIGETPLQYRKIMRPASLRSNSNIIYRTRLAITHAT